MIDILGYLGIFILAILIYLFLWKFIQMESKEEKY